MIIHELSEFPDPRAFENLVNCQHAILKNTWLSMRKWAFHLSFCRNFCSFFFFCRYLFSPNSSVLLLAFCLEGKFGWSQHLTRSRTTHGQIQLQGGILRSLLIGPDTKYIFDHIPAQMPMPIYEVEWLHKAPPQQLWPTQNRTVADEKTYIEPQAQRWKTRIIRSTHGRPIYTCKCLSWGILGRK